MHTKYNRHYPLKYAANNLCRPIFNCVNARESTESRTTTKKRSSSFADSNVFISLLLSFSRSHRLHNLVFVMNCCGSQNQNKKNYATAKRIGKFVLHFYSDETFML